MKVWVLAGLFTVATIPFAAAAEDATECQVDETRRATQTRTDAPPAPPPQVVVVRPTAEREAEPPAARDARRRNGKRIPDAELIGPRVPL